MDRKRENRTSLPGVTQTAVFAFVAIMIIAPLAGAFWIWLLVHALNRRDDPRHPKRRPDIP
jgi:hypothetical protein